MTTEIAEYSKTEAALSDLAKRYKGVIFDVTTTEGMDVARKSRAEIRTYRTSLEAKRVEIKAPALERCRLIDAEAKRITAALVELEDPIDAQIKKEERRKEEEKNAAARAEQARVEAEQRAIKEAEEKRLAAERAEIERQKAELAKAEQARLAAEAESRRKIEEEERAARFRIEEQERVARQAREAEEAKARAARQAEEDRLKAEREAIEAEKRKAEEIARKEREVEEAKKREAMRLQNELLDGRQMLEAFVTRFGHRDEFESITAIIGAFLEKKAA